MTELYLFALANFVMCMTIVFISICRLNAMKGDVLLRVKCEYAAYIGGALTSAAQPWWGEWPAYGSLAMAGVLLLGLLCSGHAWRRGDEDKVPAVATAHGDVEAAP